MRGGRTRHSLVENADPDHTILEWNREKSLCAFAASCLHGVDHVRVGVTASVALCMAVDVAIGRALP